MDIPSNVSGMGHFYLTAASFGGGRSFSGDESAQSVSLPDWDGSMNRPRLSLLGFKRSFRGGRLFSVRSFIGLSWRTRKAVALGDAMDPSLSDTKKISTDIRINRGMPRRIA